MNLGRESETLEFKRSTSELKEGVISVCAILNKHQKGELYFGIRPDGTPVGQQITEKTLRDVSQAIASHIEPQIFPEISVVSLDGKECIYVRFEGYNIPYFGYDIARIRVADEDRTMSQPELLEYIRRHQSAEDAWEHRISSCTVDDVRESQVMEYIRQGNEAGRIEFTYADKKSALNKLLLTEGDRLLNAGMVLFCESMYAELQMAVFAGTERLTFLDIQRRRGTVFELVEQAEQYIMRSIRWRVEFDGSLQRKEIPEIPAEAVREALINSFCHKDYGACQSNEVAIYRDRVEIYNPGAFPDGYVPEDFISGGERPVRRNPLIASILYYSKDVEGFGTGLKRITDACASSGCEVQFRVMKSGFVVVFGRSENKEEGIPGNEMEAIQTGNDFTLTVGGTPQVRDIAAQVITPQVETGTPQVKDDTPQVRDAAAQVITPQVETGTPQVKSGTTQVEDDVTRVIPPQVGGVAAQVKKASLQSYEDVSTHNAEIDGKVDTEGKGATQAGIKRNEDIRTMILSYCSVSRSKTEIARYCGYSDLKHFTARFLKPLLDEGVLVMTIPDKPRSSRQKYVVKEDRPENIQRAASDSN